MSDSPDAITVFWFSWLLSTFKNRRVKGLIPGYYNPGT